MAKNWDRFVQNMLIYVKLHFVATKTQGEVRQYHVCLGKPIYSSPLNQVKAISSKKSFKELTYPDLADR